jgi:low temperature requirement protein LtrA
VFVFALTQVTELMAHDATGESLLRGVLMLGLLWASWAGYAWLCNMVSVDACVVRLVLLIAMAAMLWLALSIPEAFDDLDGGLYGPLVVAVTYYVFRFMHLVMYWLLSRDDPALRRQLVRFAPFVVAGTTMLLVAATTEGTTQTLLWVLALACTVRKLGFGYAAWEYSLIIPLRTRLRPTRTVARSVTGAGDMSKAGGRCSRP